MFVGHTGTLGNNCREEVQAVLGAIDDSCYGIVKYLAINHFLIIDILRCPCSNQALLSTMYSRMVWPFWPFRLIPGRTLLQAKTHWWILVFRRTTRNDLSCHEELFYLQNRRFSYNNV